MNDRIKIFDTTLRDGEQASGFHMFADEKVKIARVLADMGVDVIEAGFAASSLGDYEAIRRIVSQIGGDGSRTICSLSRAMKSDVETSARAIEKAKSGRIHTFIATSDCHIDGKFGKDRDWVIEKAVEAISYAREFTDDVEFSCEDFARSDLDYTIDVACHAINAGATTINLPDTVGFLMPHECYDGFKYVIEQVRSRGYDAVFSVHNHNDLGLATATTLAAIMAGARQAEVTINGIGERAGNTSLEEIVAIINERCAERFECGIDAKFIGDASRLVSSITGVYPQPNKAIVGKNAFSHEAGIHQDGMIKDANTYEIMDPEDYGVKSVITFGARSGRNALRSKYDSLGIALVDDDFQIATERFFSIADAKKEIDDADVVMSAYGVGFEQIYQLVNVDLNLENGYSSIVDVDHSGSVFRATNCGNGQIDAAIGAVKEALNLNYEIANFVTSSNGTGSNSEANSRIEVTDGSYVVVGRANSTDVVTSAVQAYVDACNRLSYIERVV